MAPPIVSDDASFLTRLFSFLIAAEEKLNEMVTASGNPSGIATTTTVIEMMMAYRISVQNLFEALNSKVKCLHGEISWQVTILVHSHGM